MMDAGSAVHRDRGHGFLSPEYLMQKIYAAPSFGQVQIRKLFLEELGIPTEVRNESMTMAAGISSAEESWIELYVREADLARAQAALAEHEEHILARERADGGDAGDAGV